MLLRVSDTGPGIPEAEREHVFEEFYQIGNPSRDRTQGLGLGLAIVRRTAALLKIELVLRQRAGRRHRPSSCASRRRRPPAPAPDSAACARRAPPTARALAVLLVDDEVEVLVGDVPPTCSQLGWSVRSVATGPRPSGAGARASSPT